jgi:hypothetical protein
MCVGSLLCAGNRVHRVYPLPQASMVQGIFLDETSTCMFHLRTQVHTFSPYPDFLIMDHSTIVVYMRYGLGMTFCVPHVRPFLVLINASPETNQAEEATTAQRGRLQEVL